MKNVIVAFVFFALTLQAFSGGSVSNLKAKQRYPWNGLVDIDCVLDGTAGMTYALTVTARDKIGGTNLTVKTVSVDGVASTGNPVAATPGTYRLVWNADKDLPNGYRCEKLSISVTVTDSAKKFMIVDLSKGTISYQGSAPSGGWNVTAYKTTKMVFQYVGSGSFDQYESGSYGRKVTISKPFYMSIFPITSGQLGALTGSSTSGTGYEAFGSNEYYYDTSYYAYRLRGNDNWPSGGHTVSSTSPIGVLRSRTGKNNFDLPTAGVLGLALKSISLSGNGRACLDYYMPDLGESDVVDPMGPLYGQNVYNGARSRIYLNANGSIGGRWDWGQQTTNVRICYYDAE